MNIAAEHVFLFFVIFFFFQKDTAQADLTEKKLQKQKLAVKQQKQKSN